MKLWKQTGFIENIADYERAGLVLYGAPMDFTASFRPGTRFGPKRVREVSDGLEEYSHVLDRNLSEVPFYDAGDVDCPFGNVQQSLKNIGAATRQILADGKMPMMIGGEHLVSLPAIEAVADKYPDLVVLHFDAHADLRDEYSGEKHSHATVLGQTVKRIGGRNLYQFGIRSGTREEFAWARANTNFFPDEVIGPLMRILPELGDRPIYLTIDIDVMDGPLVPGTGTPESGGVSTREMLQVIYALKEKNVVGMDIVELAPLLDVSDVTALIVAKMVRESILAFGKVVKV